MINNKYQSQANIQCLTEDVEYRERKNEFLIINEAFQNENIHFAVICSFNLFLRGIVDEFHDVDILVEIEDVPKVLEIMDKLGAQLKATGGNGFCESDRYYNFQLGIVDIDILSGFRVLTFGTEYVYKFSILEIEKIVVNEKIVSLISLEAMYILYAMMEGWQAKRRYKRMLIEEYLLREKLEFPNILIEALNANTLPEWIEKEIQEILKK